MVLLALALAAAPDFRAGVAARVITPAAPVWMAGYASRTKPAAGKSHDLWAKALAVADAGGFTLLLLTTDLLGLPKELADAVAAEVTRRTGLPRSQLMLTSSHTHSGPVLPGNLTDMYPLTPAAAVAVAAYGDRLKGDLIAVMVEAFERRQPATLRVAEGSAGFAVNRRQETAKGVVLGVNPAGPVDRRVPVLEASVGGQPVAVVFGYACHNTTLDGYDWSGDYAGHAQLEVEKATPGAVALFWSGCGGDANPNPRRLPEHAARHGKELADAVTAALKSATPLAGRFAAGFDSISLPYEKTLTAEQLRADSLSKNAATQSRARRLLKALEAGPLPTDYPAYPVQAWRLGDGVVWVALGGEVVVDYADRLRKELPLAGRSLWATAYANDVMGYVGSARVLREGGYEADFSTVYYGLPGKWAAAVEGRIVGAVGRLVGGLGGGR